MVVPQQILTPHRVAVVLVLLVAIQLAPMFRVQVALELQVVLQAPL